MRILHYNTTEIITQQTQPLQKTSTTNTTKTSNTINITNITNTLCCHYSQSQYKSMNHIYFYRLFMSTAMQEIKFH